LSTAVWACSIPGFAAVMRAKICAKDSVMSTGM
jgi:hypothetical protein